MGILFSRFARHFGQAVAAVTLLRTSSLEAQNLYVANQTGTVTEYNATTGGAPILTITSGVSVPDALAISPVPEPGSWLLLTVGLGLLGGFQRRRRA